MKQCKVKNCSGECKNLEYCERHCAQFKKHGRILKRTKSDKNEIIDCGDYYEVCLYSGQSEQIEIARTKIDKDDLEKVEKYKWCTDTNGYATCGQKYKFLHQLIIGKKEGLVTDHINHDKLDNRKQNLRHVTKSQNRMNSKNIYGIYYKKKRKTWTAQIVKNYKKIFLGSFKNKKDAIRARKEAVKKYFGEYAYKAN